MATRLTCRDVDGVDAHVAFCTRYLDVPAGSAAAAAITAEACRALRVADSTWYEIVDRFREQGRAGVARKRRSDAGKPRTPQVVTLFLGYAKDPAHAHWCFAEKLRGFRAAMAAAGTPCAISEATLRRQIAAADPSFFGTRRERRESFTRYLHMEAPYANYVWQADQKQADFECVRKVINRDTGEITCETFRPLLFSFVDVHSGAIMGSAWFEGNHQAYSAAVVEATLVKAIYLNPDTPELPFCGVPELIYWDNGKAHTCQFTRDLAATLGIRLENSEPRRSEAHGYIEGYHRFVKDHFDAKLPHFHGSLSEQKEKPLQYRLQLDDNVIEPPALTLAQVNERWATFQVELAHRPHEAWSDKQAAAVSGQPQQLRSSFERWVSTITDARRAVPDYGALCWAKMLTVTRVVQGGTVSVQRIEYTAPNLAHLNGCEVEVRYLRDLVDRVWIVSRGTLYCVAEPERPTAYGDWSEKAARDKERRGAEKAFVASNDLLTQQATHTGVIDPAQAASLRQAARERVKKPTKKQIAAAAAAKAAQQAQQPAQADVIDLGSRRPRAAAPLSPTERVLKTPAIGEVADVSGLWTEDPQPRRAAVAAEDLL